MRFNRKKFGLIFGFLALLAIMATLILPQQIVCTFSRPDNGLKALATALAIFSLDTGRLPTEEEGLEILADSNAGAKIDGFDPGTYLTQLPSDQWKNPYHYHCYQHGDLGRTCTVFTFGRDGLPGGEGEDADVFKYISATAAQQIQSGDQ